MEVLISILRLDCEPKNKIQFPSAPAPVLLSRLIKLLTLGMQGGLNNTWRVDGCVCLCVCSCGCVLKITEDLL